MNRTILLLAGVVSVPSLLLVDSAVKGTVLLVLAAVAALILRRDSAATRHLVWLLAMVAILVVPVLSVMLPQWRVLPAWASSPRPAVVDVSPPSIAWPAGGVMESPQLAKPAEIRRPPATDFQPAAVQSDSQPARVRPDAVPTPVVRNGNWIKALPLVWAVVFAVLMLRLSAARWMLWNSERRATVICGRVAPQLDAESRSDSATLPAIHDPIVMAMEAICSQLGISRPVTLLIHPARTIPVVWGIFRCRLLLPAAARDWSDEQLRSVLLHELAHIKRGDAMTQLLTQIACALHWFNPLVWFADWRLEVERERACDDLVLASGVRPSAYAGHLLEVVTGCSSARWTQACGLAMARTSSLEGRLVAVLGKNLNRRGVSLALAGTALAIAVGIAVPIAMLGAADDEKQPEKVAEKLPAAKLQPVVPRDTSAAVLLKRWQALEGRKTPLSETRVARLRKAIDQWVNQPPEKAEADRMTALRDLNIDRAEHPVEEVIAWLDEIAAIHRGPLEFAINGETRVGTTLSAERQAALKFGPVAANGVRAAWSRYPERETYVVGDVVYSTLVLQNASEQVIEFQCPYSLDAIVTWEATADGGRKIDTQSILYTGSIPLVTWRLKPGEVAEMSGRSAKIGEGEPREQANDLPTSTVLLVKRGERATVRWKVREPLAMMTADVSFKVVGIEDVAVWSTLQAGKWPLPGGVTMEVKQENVHATDIMSTAILTWPKDKAGGTARHQIWLGGDFFTNRDPWLLAWERGATVLWAMSGQMQSSQDFHKVLPTPSSLRQIDFSNSEKITETSWGYVPDHVPDAIRAEFAKGFLPLATKPRTPDHAKPSVFTSRAEDVRPVKELLSGAWKSAKGYMDVRITFPDRPTGEVKWTMTFERPQGNATVSESLAPIDSPQDGSVRLIKNYTPIGKGLTGAMLGRLKRGIGDTLLLDIMPHVDFPEYEQGSGIVLQRVSAPVQQQESQKPKPGAKLKPATEQKLKWGEPVNGLRAALVMHPVPDEPDAEDKHDIFLVVQNVSSAKIWLHSSEAAPNPRQLIWRDKGVLETVNETARPIPADFQLTPKEVAYFRMLLPPATRNPGGRSTGSLIKESIRNDPDFDLTGKMEIATAPSGAWTGKLLSGEIKGGTAIPVVSPEENQDADAAAPFRDKLAELDAKIAALKMERVKLSGRLAPKHPNIRKLDAEVEALEEARASFVATNPQALSPKPAAASQPLPPPPVANPASVAQPVPEFVFARHDWSRPAKVAVGDGVTVAIHEEVINRADIMATARIRCTAADGAVTGHDLLIASDVSGSRAKWAYGWERGTKTFWYCSVSPDNSYSLHRVSFADPQRITDDYQQYYPGEEPRRTLGVPDAFYAQLVDVLGFQKWTVVDKSNGLPEISGQHVVSAQPMTPAGVPVKAATVLPRSKDKRWKVQFVDAATDQPVLRLRATVISRTADGSRTSYVTRVSSDGTFEPNLGGDEYAWVSVEDEKLTNAEEGVRLFGNVPAGISAVAKHTNPDAPFIVKVKARAKTANAGADPG